MNDSHSILRTFRLAGRGERACALVLGLMIGLGVVARFWNLGWDGGVYYFHPDEWAINQVVRRLGPDLNPHFFFYGSLPLYLYRVTAQALSFVSGVDWLDTTRLPVIGRFYSASAETALLVLLFLVGRSLFSPAAGLLAAGLGGATAILIQAAHFGTVDSLLTLFALGLLWLSLRLASQPSRALCVFAGILLGMALATKLTAATFALMPALSLFLGRTELRGARKRALQLLGSLSLLLGTALIVCLLFSPYYALDAHGLWAAIVEQNRELSGPPLPYTLQFTGSTPYLYELGNLVVWSLGMPLGTAALAGWVWCAVRCVRTTRRETRVAAILLTTWPTLYLLLIGTWQARFVRHTLPLVPFCCLFAAGALVELWQRGAHRPGARWAAATIVGIAVLGTGVWGTAYASIYTSPEPRLAATAWIDSNMPPGSHLVVEEKNDLVPVALPGWPGSAYSFSALAVASEDSPEKAGDFARALAQGDLVVVPNRRWSNVLPALKEYAVTARYYNLLFSGRLGYSLAATFSDAPHLGPLSWSDDAAEETFQVFDHPTVRLFRNTGHLPEATVLALLLGSP